MSPVLALVAGQGRLPELLAETLRAEGAFLVSAQRWGGVVQRVTIVSEAGALLPARNREMLVSVLDLERVSPDRRAVPAEHVRLPRHRREVAVEVPSLGIAGDGPQRLLLAASSDHDGQRAGAAEGQGMVLQVTEVVAALGGRADGPAREQVAHAGDRLVEPVEQGLELRFGLAGIAHDEGSAQRHIGHGLAQVGDETPIPFSDLSPDGCPTGRFPVLPQIDCRITETTTEAHALIRDNLHRVTDPAFLLPTEPEKRMAKLAEWAAAMGLYPKDPRTLV